MSKGARDTLILTLIGLILYGLIYYNFVLTDAIAKVNDINSKIEAVEKEKKALDDDLKNLPNLKRNLEMKNVQNDRLEEYLMSEANLADNIEYIDKLAKLFNSSFSKVKVGKPLSNTSDGSKTKYYEFGIEVDATMNYNDAMNLINYIEGGTRKVKITVFKLTPITAPVVGNATPGQNAQDAANQVNTENKYAMNLSINMYSLNLSNIDEVYEYSRKRFQRFNDGDGVIFVPAIDSAGTTGGSPNAGGTSSGVVGSNVGTPIQNTVAEGNDIEVKLYSFLSAGQNFTVNGVGVRAPIKMKIKERPSVKITFNGSDYDIAVNDGIGNNHNISGYTKNDSVRMYVLADFKVTIPENYNLGADIQIVNNSNKRVDLRLNDKINRIKVTDRNGNLILNQSESEKVYII